jgi:hypothetical protein
MEDKKRRTIQDRMDDYEGFEFDFSSNEKDEKGDDDSFLVGVIDKITKGVEELEDEDTEKRD